MNNEKNTIVALRSQLFDTIEQLKSGKLDVKTAKAISDTGQVIINSVKLELDAMTVVNMQPTEFFQLNSKRVPAQLPDAVQERKI